MTQEVPRPSPPAPIPPPRPKVIDQWLLEDQKDREALERWKKEANR